MLSNGAYEVANFLDPETRYSSASQVSGAGFEAEMDGESFVEQVGGPPPGAYDPRNYQPAWDLANQVNDIQKMTEGFQDELVAMKQELQTRGQALVDTRSQLSRVENDVVTLRADVKQWQLSMRQLHRQIRERDAERLAALSQLARNITQQVEATNR